MPNFKQMFHLVAGSLRQASITDSCSSCASQFRTAIPVRNGGIACRRPSTVRDVKRAEAKKCGGCALLFKIQES